MYIYVRKTRNTNRSKCITRELMFCLDFRSHLQIMYLNRMQNFLMRKYQVNYFRINEQR